ncbi:hypothetical protein CsatB_007548 [Cannabis sativa]|uniref:uncharacterized protein LOC115720439 n=1 Tax=Cannabis sativa TaxID=3483 RepID=UPI0011DFA7C4|nr:uncharacterized protein LOC115720439 [Cannabis sativa]
MKILSESQLEFKTYFTQVIEELQDIKIQITKLNDSSVIQERGKLPAQPQITPKGQHMAQTSASLESNLKGFNSITTRSGQSTVSPLPKTTSVPMPALDADVPQNLPVKAPFPQALKSIGKVLESHSEILDFLTQVKVNLPLLHVIKQVPTYAKVIKDICTIKRKNHVKKTAFLAEQASAVIDYKTSLKYKDPGYPTISCLGELKATSVVLQLTDRSVKKPWGIVEDVLIQIDKFYYHVDFLILDTQSEVNLESKIPIILGRPFLTTANALINCRNGLMKISFGNMTLEVNVFNIGKQPPDNDECFQSFLIDTLILEEVEAQYTSTHFNDLFEISESFESGNTKFNPEVINQLPTKRTMFWNPIFEGLPQDRETPKPSTV